ncbi:MAG: response regulator receiver protein [Myxococcales bacterium]|nr:response regulator receiver protein [Myxococcales bacterium]
MSTVLVVEDDDDLREVVLQTLARNGFTVAAARDGQEALDWLASQPLPNVILLDLMMPRMSGWEFRRRQLADARLAGVPVVVMTATHTLDEAAIHADDIVRKPLSFAALVQTIKRYESAPAGRNLTARGP